MNKNLRNIAKGLALSSIALALSSQAAINIQNDTLSGKPAFVTGQLGQMKAGEATTAIKSILANVPEYQLKGNENFAVKRQWIDKLGKVHTHLKQTINGIEVMGASLIVHSKLAANTQGASLMTTNTMADVYAVTGILASAPSQNNNQISGLNIMGASSKLKNKELFQFNPVLKKVLRIAGDRLGKRKRPELKYVYLPLLGETKLAWMVEGEYYNGPEDFGREQMFFDHTTGEHLTSHPLVYSAKAWKTYDLQNQSQNYAPGVLKCTNSQSCGEASAQRAHDGASKVYDYYLAKFGRDSIDGNGMTMISSVHLGNNYANAFWNGSQMMYGDGDGSTLGDLTLSFDVIGHELTHGVTQHTANLVYKNASGALNEAWSDIFGVSAKAYRDGTSQPNWKLAVEAYTPNTPGDAMRYMNNPTLDNYSRDWWPDRIPYVSIPTNQNDNGGVHGNSGIANLAYQLLVDGGQHPRGKSTAQVPGIGLAKAEQIFHRAIKTYMTQSTDFAGARSATAQAAQDLYGAAEKTAVETAWCAVGVGACPGTTTPPVGPIALKNGVAQTGISGNSKDEMFFTLDVPAGATNLSFNTSGGSGDADLYVKFGSQPTTSAYDCKSTSSTSTESCTISNIQAGTYYVMVQAWNQISGVSLTGSYTASTGGGGATPVNETVSNISVGYHSWKRYTYNLGSGYKDMTISISGGTGDADLYVTQGSQSSLTNYKCRPWKNGNNESCNFTNPAAGTWYIDIYGYSSASGVTLNLQANP